MKVRSPRHLKWSIVVLSTVLFCADAIGQRQGPMTPDPTRLRATSVPDGFTLAAVGDLLIEEVIPSNLDAAMVATLRDADLTMGNMETNIVDMRHFKGYATPQSHALTAPPQIAAALKSLGFDMVARANNHAGDWGIDGMLETQHHLDDAGIIHAGTGLSRQEARAPRYFTTAGKGRVALVSMASSFSNSIRSSNALGAAPAIPGINALRTRRFSIVTPPMMQGLRGIARSYADARVSTGATFGNTVLSGVDNTYSPTAQELQLFGTYFREGDSVGLEYEMEPIDLQEILASIRDGKSRADFLVATIHAHESPAKFVQTLAHAAIDNGADAFVGHGPFRLLGVEIYKGRPIFYGLSDFFNQSALTGPIPLDEFERWGEDPSKMTSVEFSIAWNARSFNSKEVYQSVIAVSRFDHGQLAELRLMPIDSYSDRPADLGIPHVASPAIGTEILKRVQQQSAAYGTNMKIDGNTGIITIR